MEEIINLGKNKKILFNNDNNSLDNLSKNHEHHRYMDDVLCFFIGNDESFAGLVNSIIYINSATNLRNKIHIFGISGFEKINSFVKDYIRHLSRSKRKLVKFTIIDRDALKAILDLKQNRAGKKLNNYYFVFNQ